MFLRSRLEINLPIVFEKGYEEIPRRCITPPYLRHLLFLFPLIERIMTSYIRHDPIGFSYMKLRP